MAAAPSTGDLDYLWRPKKTLRDWGQTEYNIVCNWTPHHTTTAALPGASTKQTRRSTNKKSTPQSQATHSPSPAQHSVPEGRTQAQSSFQGETDSPSYRLRRSTRRKTSDSSTVTWSVPNERRPANKHQSHKQSKTSSHRSHDHSNSNVDEQSQIQSSNTSYPRESPSLPPISGLALESRQALSPEQEDGVQPPWVEEADSGVGEKEEEQRPSEPVVHVSDQETEEMECGGEERDDMDTLSCPTLPYHSKDTRKSKPERRKAGKVGGKGKSTKSKRKNKTTDENEDTVVKMKPRPARRSRGGRRDLNDLDTCLNVYERIVGEATTEADDEMAERALVSHWKGTHKKIMSTIKDLRADLAVEKRSKKEKARHTRLRKELVTALKQLRKNNDVYHKALAKAKCERQSREIERVEAQIAAVGLLLQSNNCPSNDESDTY